MPVTDPEDRSFTDVLLDAFVYAPIGFALDARDVQPDLARRGRQHAAAARQIGEMAVKAGLKRLDTTQPTPDPEPSSEGDTERGTAGEGPDGGGQPESPPVEDLAIPDYDLLAASQVVKRLDALSASELEAVRLHEVSTRDRRTILHKIARLQA